MAVFDSISGVIDQIRKTDLRFPFPMTENAPDYEWIDLGDGERVIVRSRNKFNSIFVYRGQTARYQKCLPTLLRGEVDGLDLVIYRAQLSEFRNLLENPLRQVCRELGLKYDVEALAQHYGLKTLHLDVTEDLDVAAFFACCEHGEDGSWHPMTTGTGVIYRCPLLPENQGNFVGIQPYPRPIAQFAHTVHMDLYQCFERFPFVEAFEFRHSAEEGQKYLEIFEHGKRLFPDDLLARKAQLIANNPRLSTKTLRREMKADGLEPSKIRQKIREIDARLNEARKGKVADRKEHEFSKKEFQLLRTYAFDFKAKIHANTGLRMAFYPKGTYEADEQSPSP